MTNGQPIHAKGFSMIMKLKYLLFLGLIGISGLTSWKTYTYFFDTTCPSIVLKGVSQNGCYAKDVPCSVISSKNGEISIWLDKQELVNKFRIVGNQEGYPFTIPTKTIANDNHVLRIEITDSSFHKNKSVIERHFSVDNVPLQAALVKPDAEYKVFQGRTLHVQLQVNKQIKEAKISALSQKYDCFTESKNSSVYEAFIPISCEEKPNEYLFSVDITDNVGNTIRLDNKFQVVLFPFKKQTLNISDEKVKEEVELGKNSKSFSELIEKLTQSSPKQKLWKGTFCTPIEIQRVTTDYGTVRTTQHKGRYTHKALDVINLPKSVVWATQDGVVVLKDRFSFSGNTVVIDHGMGLLSLFFHLHEFADIQEGDKIAHGNKIGTIGKTGYASGYHLHWEMRLNDIPIDPMQWTKSIF